MAKKINIIANLVDEQFRKQVQDIENGQYKINVDVDNEKISQTSKHVKQVGNAASNTNNTFGKLKNTISDTFSTGRITMTAFLAVLNEIHKAGKNAKQTIEDIDKAITDLSVATNMSREATANLVKDYNDYAKKLKSTTTQVTSAADDWLRAGKSMSEAKELIKDSVMLSKLGQIDSSEATEDLLATMNGYEMSIEEVNNALDAMVAIDMQAATSAGDLATGLKYSASSASSAELSFNKLVAILGTVQDKTQQSAEVVGTFANTMLSRYRDITIGKYLSDDGEDISNYEAVLKSIGIELRDSQGEFRAFEDVLQEMSDKWDTLTSVQQNALIKVAAGTRQQNRFIALMEGYNKVLELTEVAANSAGTAIDKFNNSYVNSLEAKQNALKASFESMVINSDFDEVYSGIIEATTALVNFINQTNALKGVMVGLTVSTGIKFFLAAKTGANEAYISLNKFANALKIVKQTNISTADFERLLLLSNDLSESQMKLLLSSKNLNLAQKELILVNSGLSIEEAKLKLETWGMSTAQTGLTATTTTLGNAFKGLWETMAANPIMIVTIAISGAVMAYQSYNRKLEETRQRNIEASESAIEQANSLRELYSEYSRLSAIQEKTNSEEEAFETVVENVTKALGNKAQVLEGLTAGTNEYADALAKVTKEELQSASVNATIGRKSAEEELQRDIWDDWKGSLVTIDSSSKGKSISDDTQRAIDIVSDVLKDFETINRTWNNLSWDIASDNPEEVLAFYNAVLKAREELVLASENDEALLETEIYSDMNNAINLMEESLDSYITKRYEEEKLNYMVLYGIPQTAEEYNAMQKSLINAAGASQELQDEFNTLLMTDFSALANGIDTIEDAQTDLLNITPNIENISSTISSSVQQIATQLEPQFAKLGDAYKAIFTDNGFTLDDVDNSMLEELRQSFAEIEEEIGVTFDSSKLNSFFDALTSGNSTAEQVQQAFNDLATAYFYSTDTLEQLNSETAEAIEKQLEELGVVNAKEVVFDTLNAKTEALALQEQFLAQNGYALADASSATVIGFLNEAGASETARAYLFQLISAEQIFNNQELNPKEKIENLKALATAYGQTAIAAKIANMESAAESGHTQIDYEKELNSLQNQINSAINNVQIDFSGVGGGTSGASSAGSDAGDAYVDAYEKEVEKLDDLKSQGKITEKQYLDALKSLYEKYFKNIGKYAEKYAEEQSKYLSGLLNLYDSALSGISKLMSNKIDAVQEEKEVTISALEEEKESRLEAIDLMREQLEAEIDLIDEQIDAKQEIIDGIQDEIDAMREANEERKREQDLMLAKYNLEKMLNQRTKLVYTDEKGMVYRADESGITNAKQAVDDAQLEIDIAAKEKEISLIEDEIDLLEKQKDAIQDQIDALDKQSESIEKYYSKMIEQQEKYFDSMINNMENQKSKWEELADIQEVAEAYSAIEQVFGELGYSVEDVLNGSEGAFEDFKTKYLAIISDMNQNTSFQEGLEYASGIAKECFGSIVNDSQGVKDALSDIGTATSDLEPVANALNNTAEGMNNLNTSASNASTNTSQIVTDMGTLNTNASGLTDNLTGISNALSEIPDAEKFNSIADAFANLGESIKDVATALGVGEEGTVGGLVNALQSISEISLGGEDNIEGGQGTGIISQFNNLKTAVVGVTSAIGGSAGSGNSDEGASNSKSPSMSNGAVENGEGSLISAITKMGETAAETLGEGSDDSGSDDSGDGVISKFSQLKAVIDTVTSAIGTGEDDEGSGKEGAINLIGALQAHYDKAEETLPEVKTLFEDLLVSIEACVSALNNMVSVMSSMPELGLSGVSIPSHSEGTVGKAFANGTGKYKGLPKSEKNALRSEYGQPELTVYPNGTTELTTEPTMSDLPKDTVIFNEDQTKRILNNKGTVIGNAHVNGSNKDGSITLPDGSVIRPLRPGDESYELMQMAEKFAEKIRMDGLVNPVNSINDNLQKMVNNINNVQNNNSQQIVNTIENVNVTCPGITSDDVAKQIGSALKKEFDGMSLRAYQKMSITR